MPGTEDEKLISEIWQQVLGLDKIGIDDSFFELGGNSLDLIKVNDSLKENFQTDIPMANMFR